MSAKLSPVMLGMPCWSRLIVARSGAASAGEAAVRTTITAAAAIDTAQTTRAKDGPLGLLPYPIGGRHYLPNNAYAPVSPRWGLALGEDLGLLALELGIGERAGLPQLLEPFELRDLTTGSAAAGRAGSGRAPGKAVAELLRRARRIQPGAHPRHHAAPHTRGRGRRPFIALPDTAHQIPERVEQHRQPHHEERPADDDAAELPAARVLDLLVGERGDQRGSDGRGEEEHPRE